MGWSLKNAYLVPILMDPDEDMQQVFLWAVTILQVAVGLAYIKREAGKAHRPMSGSVDQGVDGDGADGEDINPGDFAAKQQTTRVTSASNPIVVAEES